MDHNRTILMAHIASDLRPAASVLVQALFLGAVGLVASAHLVIILGSLGAPQVYRKDLLQDYCSAAPFWMVRTHTRS